MAATTTQRTRHESVLMLYESYASADVAVGALARAGLSMAHVSAVGLDCEADDESDAPSGASLNRFTRGAWRRVGPRMNGHQGLVIPGFARIVVMGPRVYQIAGACERGVVGGAAGMLREVLIGIGVTDGSVVRCGVAVKRGGVLMLVPAALEGMEHANPVLDTVGGAKLPVRAGLRHSTHGVS